MTLFKRDAMKANPGAEGWFQSTGHEMFEIHLFDEDAAEEQTLCGKATTGSGRRCVGGYLEDRLDEIGVGTVCEMCKTPAAHFAMNISRDLEADEMEEEAEDYRELAVRLARETGLDRGPD